REGNGKISPNAPLQNPDPAHENLKTPNKPRRAPFPTARPPYSRSRVFPRLSPSPAPSSPQRRGAPMMAWAEDEAIGPDVASAGLHVSERIGRDAAAQPDLEEALEASRYA
uniref:Uncharacterized protein n=1 Tax=Aegilops tauschii subsp. strangulata TaxID=200361 RepID=A0A453ILR9_AEGTS